MGPYTLERVPPLEVAELHRIYVQGLTVPTLTYLDFRLRENIESIGVRVDGEPVAVALVRPAHALYASPVLVGLVAPGQSFPDLHCFFRQIVEEYGIRSVWGRTDDAILTELLLVDDWKILPRAPLLLLEDVVEAPSPAGVEIRHLEHADLAATTAFMGSLSAEERGKRGDDLRIQKLLHDRVLDGLFVDGKLRGLCQLHPQYEPVFVSLEVIIAPALRRQGLGVSLASAVAHAELEAGRQVVAILDREQRGHRAFVEALGSRLVASYYIAVPPESSGRC